MNRSLSVSEPRSVAYVEPGSGRSEGPDRPMSPHGRRHAICSTTSGLTPTQMRSLHESEPDVMLRSQRKDVVRERAEISSGAVTVGVVGTKSLAGDFNVGKLAPEVAGVIADGLGTTGAALGIVDSIGAVVAVKKAYSARSSWKEFSTGDQATTTRAQQLKSTMGQLRGTEHRHDASHIDKLMKDNGVKPEDSASIRFGIDPRGVDSRGRPNLSSVSPKDQEAHLLRIAKHAEGKCSRRVVRKTVEGVLSAASATATLTGAGAPVGIGLGVARGSCTVVRWCKNLYKRACGTLGQAREQNAKALLELATSPHTDPGVKLKANALLQKLGVDISKFPKAYTIESLDHDTRRVGSDKPEGVERSKKPEPPRFSREIHQQAKEEQWTLHPPPHMVSDDYDPQAEQRQVEKSTLGVMQLMKS